MHTIIIIKKILSFTLAVRPPTHVSPFILALLQFQSLLPLLRCLDTLSLNPEHKPYPTGVFAHTLISTFVKNMLVQALADSACA